MRADLHTSTVDAAAAWEARYAVPEEPEGHPGDEAEDDFYRRRSAPAPLDPEWEAALVAACESVRGSQ